MPEQSDSPGILGDGELHAGKYNMALVRRAIKNGWNVPADIKASVVAQMAKIIEKSEEERNQIAAAKVLVSADAVDLSTEKVAQPAAGTTVNVAVVNQIQVNETDDWYGTKAAANGHVAASNGTPAGDPAIAGPVQSDRVRPALGQNGAWTNGHAQGPRSDEGPAAGGD